MALWGGRFSEPTDADLRNLNDSIDFDQRMVMQDIAGSIAYARAIQRAGVISVEEADTLIRGLEAVRAEFERAEFVLADGDEDIHTAVERRLTELVGPVGGKLHTGRSRNDQVATDFRLWVLQAIDDVATQVRSLQQAMVDLAQTHVNTVMPGYTHLQPAQPISAAHWLMSFFWMLQRDYERLLDTRRRTSVLPLGSGALAGNPFDIDRQQIAHDLGFSSYSHNSLDAVSDRDFAAELLFTLSLMGVHLSRLAEDIILYSNPLFGFIILNDRYSTGSSIMPQKRNADPMELTRGKTGRIIGHLTGLLTTLKGLPSTYNKDLQEDKEPVFDAVDTINRLLPVITAVIMTLDLQPERMRNALNDDLLATDLAEYLVDKGMPFREAHHVIGSIVRYAGSRNTELSQLTLEELQRFSELFDTDSLQVFDFQRSLSLRKAEGGTAPDAVLRQLEAAKSLLSV